MIRYALSRTRRALSALALGLTVVAAGAATSQAAPSAAPRAEKAHDLSRIVSIGSSVTETVHALTGGVGLVGVDGTSLYPPQMQKLPQVGVERQLAAEGILALRPSLVILTEAAGPPSVVPQLRAAGVPVVTVTADHGLEGARRRILAIAQVLGREAAGAKLARTLDEQAKASRLQVAKQRTQPKVLFIYARGHRTIQVAGAHTAADEMLRLAGATNAVTGFNGYKPLTAEAAVKAAPDIILLPATGAESLGGVEAILNLPGIALTPAGKHRRILHMDDLLMLGFGPRTGAAIGQLNAALAAAFRP